MPDETCWACDLEDTLNSAGKWTMSFDATNHLQCLFRWRQSWNWHDSFSGPVPKARRIMQVYLYWNNGTYNIPIRDWTVTEDFTSECNTLTENGAQFYNLDDDPNITGYQPLNPPMGAITFYAKIVVTLQIVDTVTRPSPCDIMLPPSDQLVITASWSATAPPWEAS